jgi:hypothetical protein
MFSTQDITSLEAACTMFRRSVYGLSLDMRDEVRIDVISKMFGHEMRTKDVKNCQSNWKLHI